MDKIAIFCSASDNIDPVYFDKARELGTWMGQNGKTLIYGGANIGLMECVARAAKENGSMVMGVVPTKLEERGRVSDLLDVTFRTDNLSDRKDVMLHEADVVVALPGGVGTLDEIFHVMAAATLDYHHKKSYLQYQWILEWHCGISERTGNAAFCTSSAEQLLCRGG